MEIIDSVNKEPTKFIATCKLKAGDICIYEKHKVIINIYQSHFLYIEGTIIDNEINEEYLSKRVYIPKGDNIFLELICTQPKSF